MSPAHAGRRGVRAWIAAGVAALVVLGAGGVGAYALLHSRTFSATTVRVTGERHESVAQIVNVAGLAGAPPMLSVDTSSVAGRLEARFAWIASVTVTKHWPHTVTIVLTERTPVAVVAAPHGTWVLVDETGRRLGPPGAGQVLPQLEYVPPAGAAQRAGSPLPSAAQPGLIVASTLPPAFASQVSVIQVDSTGAVALHLSTPVTFLLGSATNLGSKYEDIAAVIARTTLHAGDVVDVSVPQAMTVSGP